MYFEYTITTMFFCAYFGTNDSVFKACCAYMQGRIQEVIDDAFDVDKSKVEGYNIYYTAWNGIWWCTFYFYSVVVYWGVNSQYVVISFPYKNINVHQIHVSHNNNDDGDDTKVEKVRTVAHKARWRNKILWWFKQILNFICV